MVLQVRDKSTVLVLSLVLLLSVAVDVPGEPGVSVFVSAVVEEYAANNDVFLKDFQKAVRKLFELGVPFQERHGISAGLARLFWSAPEVQY